MSSVANPHSTARRTNASIRLVGVVSDLMAYEWDAARVRKAYRVKMAVACLVAMVMVAAPVWLIVAGLA